ncbi:MAG: hypothetical protein A6F71_01535 [Cycloclasticus sp. symbiont of Poecilosclerida sp. M]|nr:MAG: hypothetical protein A6F71_01535 [Cycloclasticus sp. symbiont of Poecilosclerida sp. M]
MKFFGLIALLVLSIGLAQAAPIKIGFVNAARIVEKSPQAEKVRLAIEKEFSPRSKRLVARQKSIKALEETLVRDAKLKTEAQNQKLGRDLRDKARDLKRSHDEFREDLNLRRNAELNKLQKLVFEAIKNFAEAEKYDIILHDGVIYASQAVDITAKIQKRLAKAK